ncbi:MAG TPA: metallophosphoesterase, partial [Acidimicrobiia bacterium]|nr:metallophosphoesterase [Acidimicrobiia bacterium]
MAATVNGTTDNSPATATWTVDTTAPGTPSGLAATTPSPTSVKLTWNAATDNTGVTGYDVFRDGTALTTVGAVTTYTDTTVAGGSTHQYMIRARDIAGNVSPFSAPVTATTPTPPDTVVDSAPPAGTTTTTATFTFHSTITPATFTCKLDTGTAAACTSPKTYTGLTQAAHTFTVFATANGLADPTPATATWTVDSTPPSTPTGLAATAPSATSVALTWNAATDNTGVTGYDVFRDGSPLTTIGAVTNYTDSTVAGGSTHTYAVRARDVAGNVSALSSTVTIATPLPMDAHLTRAPYLTDLVGLNVIVNFGTDRSTNTASVQYGSSNGTACALTNTVPATSVTISVNGTFEYQWKARLALPAAGQYCYRVFLGATDLLGANASPVFTTQVQPGSSESFSFVVFGDWGQVDATGANPDQARLMRQIANSGARFAITTGDNGYPSGSQGNYGDLQQTGADTSAIFGPSFWGGVGSTLPLFPVVGNHGLARSDAVHPHFANWPQDTAVATSAGRYQIDTYCCPNGSASANYPSAWYAFDAGGARFYMLDAAWADLNTGTGTPYANEWASHWQPTSPEYLWLKADLAAHRSGLKFAFFHYPMYADTSATDEQSDTFLQGNASLEGLLASNGVNLAFSGHAHLYERNAPAGGKNRQSLVTYVTGGGGAQVQSNSACSANDKYSVGWSFTRSVGTSCGGAPVPTSPTQVYHFLKVTVAGSRVTVTPTDELGRTFDVQTYTFNALPDTYIDTAPAAGTTSTSATFTFHASATPATFTCKLDANTVTTCTSPITYNGLAQGVHNFSVFATVNNVKDPAPATAMWTVDSTPPSTPTGFTATATSPFSVALTWNAATDSTGVTAYDVLRDGTVVATIAPATGYVDTNVVGASTHLYAVRARDVAGNLSPVTTAIPVTTPPPPVPVFQDGFESGDLSAWTASSGLVVEGSTVHGGTHAAEGSTTTGATFAKKTLPSTYPDAYARVWFDAVSGPSQINLVRMRDAAGNSIGYVYIETTGQLGFHDDATGTNTLSATVPGPGWHALELHLQPSGVSGVVEIWLDNTLVTDLSGAGVDVGTAPVGQLQIGEVQTALTYDVVFDDVAFGTARLGPVADANPPSVPANVNATATSPFTVALTWDPSTDDGAVAGYDVWRDGQLLASVGAVTTYTDTTVLPNTTHSYAVVARDTAGNASAQSTAATVMTPP